MAVEKDAAKAEEKDVEKDAVIEIEVGVETQDHHGADHRGVEIQLSFSTDIPHTPLYHIRIASNIYVRIIIDQEDAERKANVTGDMIIVFQNHQH